MDEKVGCFVSIPKCASKSVLVILGLGRNRDSDDEETGEHHVIYENHQRLRVLQDRYELGDKFVFGFVRNPYDRLVSWFAYHRRLSPYSAFTFRDWILAGCPSHWTVQNRTDWRSEGLSPLLQHNFLEPGPVDLVGRIERFEQDLQTVVAALNRRCVERGIARRFAYRAVKINASTRRARPESYFDRDTAAQVYELFRPDFEAYGYLPLRADSR